MVFESQHSTVEAQHCALLISLAGTICYPVCCNLQPILLCCNDIEGIGLRQLVTHFWQEYLAMGEWQLAESCDVMHAGETMISGYTGEAFRTDIFIGPVYYQRLRHMVSDKFQVCCPTLFLLPAL